MTATLARQGTFYVSSFAPVRRFAKRDNGNLVYEGVPVFRSGTFRDSMGEQNTWEDIHMRQMAENFSYLSNNNIFNNVPVRDGHPGWIMSGTPGTGAVVGWHTGVSTQTLKSPVDGKEYTYFLADYEITEQYAVEKIERGTWRNRSAEMLRYLTNDEAEFWPVYGGFAFVDIPAVEGLNFSAPAGTRFVMLDEETVVSQPLQGQPAASGVAQLLHGARPLPGTQQNPTSVDNHVFTINGAPVTDPAAVQQYITTLEQFRNETQQTSRDEFIEGLAARGVILASAMDEFKNLAATMSADQWAMWTKGYEAVTPGPLLSQHAAPAAVGGTQQGGLPQGGAGGSNAVVEDLDVAKGIVAMHRSMGMKDDKLKRTPSYRKLVAAGIEQA